MELDAIDGDMSPEMLTVKELKAKLGALGAPTDGLKSVLVARLTALVEPTMRSAEDAAADRARAGESRAVEHVAELSAEQAAAAGHAGVAKRKQGGGARAGAAKRTKA